VVDRQSVPVDTLAKAEGVREPNISATLQILEEGDLVIMDRADEDKRVWNAKPTKKAERKLK
jgi:DNA-binding MarR family transcriptional regulator